MSKRRIDKRKKKTKKTKTHSPIKSAAQSSATGSKLQRTLNNARKAVHGGNRSKAISLIDRYAQKQPIQPATTGYITLMLRVGLVTEAVELIKTDNLPEPLKYYHRLLAEILPLLPKDHSDLILKEFPEWEHELENVCHLLNELENQSIDFTQLDLSRISIRSRFINWRLLIQGKLFLKQKAYKKASKAFSKIPVQSLVYEFAGFYQKAIRLIEGDLSVLKTVTQTDDGILTSLLGDKYTEVKQFQLIEKHIDQISPALIRKSTVPFEFDTYIKKLIEDAIWCYSAKRSVEHFLEWSREYSLHLMSDTRSARYVVLWFLSKMVSDHEEFEELDELFPRLTKIAGLLEEQRRGHRIVLLYRMTKLMVDALIDYDPSIDREIRSQADRWLSRLEELDPDNLKTKFLRYEFLRLTKDKQVRAYLESLLSDYPENAEFACLAAKAATHRKAYQKAMKFIDHALKVDPLNPEYQKSKAFILSEICKNHISIKVYDKAEVIIQQAKKLIETYADNWAVFICEYLLYLSQNNTEGTARLERIIQTTNPWLFEDLYQELSSRKLKEYKGLSRLKQLLVKHSKNAPKVSLDVLYSRLLRFDEYPQGNLEFAKTVMIPAAANFKVADITSLQNALSLYSILEDFHDEHMQNQSALYEFTKTLYHRFPQELQVIDYFIRICISEDKLIPNQVIESLEIDCMEINDDMKMIRFELHGMATYHNSTLSPKPVEKPNVTLRPQYIQRELFT